MSGRDALWLLPLDGTSATALPGTEVAEGPFWSPDSKSIAFWADGKLRRIDIGNRSPEVICDAPTPMLGGTWAADGTIVFARNFSGLMRVSAAGGTPVALTHLDAAQSEDTHMWPQALPGRKFLYWARSQKTGNQAVYGASLDNPADRVRILTSETSAFYSPSPAAAKTEPGYLLWVRGSTLVAQKFDVGSLRVEGDSHPLAGQVTVTRGQPAVAVSGTGLLAYDSTIVSTQPVWLDRAGNSLGAASDLVPATEVSLSPDSRRAIFVVQKASGYDLWLREWERGISTRLTFAEGINQSPVWSPDGLSLVFSKGNPHNLYRMRVGGAESAVRLTQFSNYQDPTDWSRDGLYVLFQERNPENLYDIWVLPLGKPNARPQPYLKAPFNERNARFSPEPNPRWVAYESDETGRREIYVQGFPEPRGKVRISTDGGAFPEWGPGGRELFYLSAGNKLMLVSLKMGAESILPTTPSVLFAMPPVSGIVFGSPYLVDSTGQRFLVLAAPPKKSSPLSLIVNWQSLMKMGAASR